MRTRKEHKAREDETSRVSESNDPPDQFGSAGKAKAQA